MVALRPFYKALVFARAEDLQVVASMGVLSTSAGEEGQNGDEGALRAARSASGWPARSSRTGAPPQRDHQAEDPRAAVSPPVLARRSMANWGARPRTQLVSTAPVGSVRKRVASPI